MRRFIPALFVLATPFAALAEPTLAPEEAIKAEANPEFLMALMYAATAGEHCADFMVSPEELALLTATVDQVKVLVGVPEEEFENEYFGQANFDILVDETCPRDGPNVRPTLDKVIALGGVAG